MGQGRNAIRALLPRAAAAGEYSTTLLVHAAFVSARSALEVPYFALSGETPHAEPVVPDRIGGQNTIYGVNRSQPDTQMHTILLVIQGAACVGY